MMRLPSEERLISHTLRKADVLLQSFSLLDTDKDRWEWAFNNRKDVMVYIGDSETFVKLDIFKPRYTEYQQVSMVKLHFTESLSMCPAVFSLLAGVGICADNI